MYKMGGIGGDYRDMMEEMVAMVEITKGINGFNQQKMVARI